MDDTNVKVLNMDEKIVLKSIAGWDVGFSKKDGTSVGDITIPANGSIRIARGEVFAQSQYGNKLINGIDNAGSHATVFIDDKDTRVELNFESEDGKIIQNFLSEDKVKKMFETKTLSSFEKQLKDNVVTRAEKYAFIEMIKKFKFNDFDKIRLAEQHTGFNL